MCVVDWSLLLEYLKVIVSWPVIGGLLIAYFLRKFSAPITDLIKRVSKANLWGAEVETTPQADANLSPSATAAAILPNASTDVVPASITAEIASTDAPDTMEASGTVSPILIATDLLNASNEVKITTAEHSRLVDQSKRVKELEVAAYTWHFFYMNYFFALSTQLTINALRVVTPDGIWSGTFDLDMQRRITSPIERAAVIKALVDNGLIVVADSKYRLSSAGLTYADWNLRALSHTLNTENDAKFFAASLQTVRSICSPVTVS